MEVAHGTETPQNDSPATITLMDQADSEEEDEVTITAEATLTPPLEQCHGHIGKAPPAILVTRITSGTVCVDRTPLVSEDGPFTTHHTHPPPAHSKTTTTTTTAVFTTSITTSSCVTTTAPVAAVDPPRWPRGSGSPSTQPTTRKAAASPASTAGTGGGKAVARQRVSPRAPHVPPSAPCGVKAAHITPASTTGATAAQPQHGEVPNTPVEEFPARSSPLCSFCGCVVGGGDAPPILHLQIPLPHSLLSVSALLHCLGLSPPLDVIANGADQTTVCDECRALVSEGDEVYRCLLQVTAGMRRRWSAIPTTPEGARRVRPILPKLPLAPDTGVTCELCGVTASDWRTHTAIHHRLSPRWRRPRLLPSLKACLTEELQRGSGRRGTHRCPACPNTSTHPEDFLWHLRDYHRYHPPLSLLPHPDESEGSTQPPGVCEATAGVTEQLQEELLHAEVIMQVKEDEEDEEGEEEEQSVEGAVLATDEAAEDVESMKAEEEEMMDESVLKETAIEEHTEEGSDSVEGQDAGANPDGCPRRLGIGLGWVGGARWRCRVCAATFTSQHDHDIHKAAVHPGSVRAGRGRTQPAPAPGPTQGVSTAGANAQITESPTAAPQEGAIVIMEGDGRGGVTHRRLQPPQAVASRPGSTAALVCEACGEVFQDRASLLQHRQATHPGVGREGGEGSEVLVECEQCGRRVFGQRALSFHQVRVHGRPAHPSSQRLCRVCMVRCRTRSQLERHMREHHGAPPSQPPVCCGECGKIYSARYIDRHVANMHSDGGRFPCSFCPMRFGDKNALRSHVSLEHANTTWSCRECPLQFAKYHQLRQHYLYVHSNAEHRCPECPRVFKRRSDMTEHVKRQHRQRPSLECSFCPKVYSDRKRLRLHLIKKHGVPWEDTLAQGYAHRRRENNCLRRRRHQHQQPPRSPRLPLHQHQQQQQAEAGEGVGVLGEDQPQYSDVGLSEAPPPPPHTITDTISYIILEEA